MPDDPKTDIIVPICRMVPVGFKLTLGDRIQHLLGDLLEQYLEAYHAPTVEKRLLLKKANLSLKKLPN